MVVHVRTIPRHAAASLGSTGTRAKVIVATDGSASTIAAAGRALQLLGPGVDVEVVTAGGTDDASIVGALPGPGLLPPRAQADRASQIRGRLPGTVLDRTMSALGVGGEGRVLGGPPGPAICRRAHETGADVVVVHPHGKGLLERALFGSVSRYVVDNADCTVLVAR